MKTKAGENTRRMVTCAMFIAIIVVMTVVPYTGYINYSPLNISITTLHIPVILGAVLLGWKYGALLGGVWGLTCVIKAFLEPIPANIPFQNPVISLIPRVVVGIVAGLLFYLFASKLHANKPLSVIIAAIGATLTNTVLVLSAYAAFGNLGDATLAEVVKFIFGVLIAVNGLIELGAAVIITPLLYAAVTSSKKKK